jgi:hypothetical protein
MRCAQLIGVVAACAILATAGVCQAGLLGLTEIRYPDIYTSNITVTYDADGAAPYGLLEAKWGLPSQLTLAMGNSLDLDIFASTFTLTAKYDPAQGKFISGTLLIEGDYDGQHTGVAPRALFSSTQLTGLGSGATDRFEFLFTEDVQTPILEAGQTIGIIMDARYLSPGTVYLDSNRMVEPQFDQDFTGNGFAYSDTFYVPEPATLGLLLLGAIGLVRRRRS